MNNKKPILQVCIIHGGAKAYWLTADDKPMGRKRYSHPDCEIYFKGSRNHHVDHTVMIALQSANMSAGALVYVG